MSSETQSNLGDSINPVQSDVWYDDGNVVLQAQNTHFKVYRGVLAQISSVFKDMFSFPQPPSAEMELIDGCPVVHLSDRAEDVRYLLQAIFQREYVADGEKIPFAVLSAFLSLGGKYEISKLRVEAMKKLYREFPITLAGTDSVCRKWVAISPGGNRSMFMELAILARKEGVFSVLPYLLYQCCRSYSVTSILEGAVGKDGRKLLLSHQDQLACLVGHRRLCEVQAKTTFMWAYDKDFISATCASSDCHHARQQFLLSSNLSPVPAIAGLSRWQDNPSFSEGLCESCAMKAVVQHNVGRAIFWQKLPVLLGLPSWTELKKEREAVRVYVFDPRFIR
ncbi:hypothetical protein FIBSPDRAFT_828576 [Athelia psychrophila]|uniref:BTB domain-containing protein n=1 Tax=Athelia psychrophila TaxID=1759441 RepID=A0A166HM42_9AGAM|nr:hypothetical protein FIBSPDRAFT_828576 [Fibularhizoctonia sp. CBS 109695]